MDLQAYPYASRRSVVLAANGVVATSQPLAAQAGLDALRRGGSAVDAAIATAIVLTVVEPTSNGIGADAFAIVWDGRGLHGLNGSGRAPAALGADELRARGDRDMPQRGWSSVTVPGAPDTWLALHERFGRLDFDSLVAPAIAIAEEGFAVSPVVATLWSRGCDLFQHAPDPAMGGWAEAFAPAGRAPRAGERFRAEGHAWTLGRIAEHGVRDFYEGETAARLAEFSARTGGLLSGDDLAAHRSEWVEPIRIAFRDHEVWEIPPNGQGIAALVALGILDGLDAGAAPHPDAATWHRQIEAMKLAFADTYRYVADPAHVAVPVEGLLDVDYLASRRAAIGDEAAEPEVGRPPGGGTVYLCAADRDGMMVSFIQSNYMGFGSGIVVPGTGVSLQNRAAGFTLEAGHPNEAAGGKRPRHTIIPAFLTRGGAPVGPFGVMGGEMQPQGHLQVVAGMLDHDLNPQAALDMPRWQIGAGLDVMLEPGADPALASGLASRGHRVLEAPDSLSFGRGQIIARLDDGVYAAGSEPRADGAAAGY